MNDEVLRDPDAPAGAESDFWYDPDTIPQYELLVRDGRVTQEEADMHRQGRAEMGLAMTFAELQARPHPRFAWLREAGGPSLAGSGDTVEIDGRRWRADAWSNDDRPGNLEHHDKLPDDGYLRRQLSKPHDKPGVRWDATFKLPGHERAYARVGGHADTFQEALARVVGVDFGLVQTWGGATWYPHGTGWLAVVDGSEVSIAHWAHIADETGRWRWASEPPEGAVTRRMAVLFGNYCLAGYAATQDAAVSAALAAHAQLQALAVELLSLTATDEFERGRQAGRAELKARIIGSL